jgi:hypothetical protein
MENNKKVKMLTSITSLSKSFSWQDFSNFKESVKLGKLLCLPYYCLCLLFNKIVEEGRTSFAWK